MDDELDRSVAVTGISRKAQERSNAAVRHPAMATNAAAAATAFVTAAHDHLPDDAFRELLAGDANGIAAWVAKWRVDAPAIRQHAAQILNDAHGGSLLTARDLHFTEKHQVCASSRFAQWRWWQTRRRRWTVSPMRTRHAAATRRIILIVERLRFLTIGFAPSKRCPTRRQAVLPRTAAGREVRLIGPLTMWDPTDPGDAWAEWEASITPALLEGLAPIQVVASLMPASWNQIAAWLQQMDAFRRAA